MAIQSLHIEGTTETPEVLFQKDQNSLYIGGKSLPEDAYSFYSQLIDWAEAISIEDIQEPLIIRFDFDYFNSASGRYILEFLATLERTLKDPGMARVEWLVDRDDELMIEKGEEFSSLLDLKLQIHFRS